MKSPDPWSPGHLAPLCLFLKSFCHCCSVVLNRTRERWSNRDDPRKDFLRAAIRRWGQKREAGMDTWRFPRGLGYGPSFQSSATGLARQARYWCVDVDVLEIKIKFLVQPSGMLTQRREPALVGLLWLAGPCERPAWVCQLCDFGYSLLLLWASLFFVYETLI